MNTQELIDFEEDIASEFNNAKIRSPVHLYYGNEDEMIKVFKNINQDDWVLCTWRSHYQCLLKGVPPEDVKQKIMEGNSISLCFPEHNIYSSAIVTGVLPIGVGIALDIKRSNKKNKVYVFVGDMTAETGCFSECLKYSINHKLPIKFIIEDNGKSVCTDTSKVWNNENSYKNTDNDYIYYYRYETKWPHAGAGSRVQF
jgi:TPP-dependent pyruvate/acetoin dehydrogenase alpha subunit